jgi:hypothetical protein
MPLTTVLDGSKSRVVIETDPEANPVERLSLSVNAGG